MFIFNKVGINYDSFDPRPNELKENKRDKETVAETRSSETTIHTVYLCL